ncbi:hypothetical protein RclHR1_34580001 [Rhizophagus clarus]|nr:hypothetical protein RclHR1_34580001 [Rhizophagus clarus]
MYSIYMGYPTSESIWNGLKVAPILADEIQTFKALITVHKVIRGGHPVTLKEAQSQNHVLVLLQEMETEVTILLLGFMLNFLKQN